MKSIPWSSELEVRFCDLDRYGHVSAATQLDYVVSSRWAYARVELGLGDAAFAERNVGFFIRRAELAFRRPIADVGRVLVHSHVAEITETSLTVPFEIRSADGETLFTTGALDVAVIDLAAKRPISCPRWVRALFVEDVPS